MAYCALFRAPFAVFLALLGLSSPAKADEPLQEPRGAPPPDATALVSVPKFTEDAPTVERPMEAAVGSLAAGGQLATGNSRMIALTANGTMDARFGRNGVGLSFVGNYGESASPGNALVVTAENAQARARYDRFVIEDAGFFLVSTLRHDRFQGLEWRYNLDPGFKYLLSKSERSSVWLEAGYDFQGDVRRDDARILRDARGSPVLGAAMLQKTVTDHSTRVFLGAKHAFNKEVSVSTGVEYLQSFVDPSRYRVNYDLLFSANVGKRLAVGLGFSARYDHVPLPNKQDLDTATTVSLIYSYSNAPDVAAENGRQR
ncbi:MAG: DUF481 domain-containing protein [Myxococcota bacterium]|nr:DUF481 domain-containing protein [Myxococcota bacterium]